MRTGHLLLSLLALGTPAAAQLPPGWTARADRGPASGIKLSPMGPGIHVSPGSSGIAYREQDLQDRPFRAEATFTQTRGSTHPEGYGLFFAGKDLDGDGQAYTYFLIRSDGRFLVKQRKGAETPTVVPWTAHEAVLPTDSEGKATNKLEIDATGPRVAFKVNGKTVHEAEIADRTGVVGLRVNHDLDLHIDGFQVQSGSRGAGRPGSR